MTPELPPLDLHCESGRTHAAYTPDSVEARESILVAEIERLRSDNARLRGPVLTSEAIDWRLNAEEISTQFRAMAQDCVRLRAEVEAMRADADRYQFLKADTSTTFVVMMRREPEEWDATIDAARGAP